MVNRFNSRLIEDGYIVEVPSSKDENLDLEIESLENYLEVLKEQRRLRDEE